MKDKTFLKEHAEDIYRDLMSNTDEELADMILTHVGFVPEDLTRKDIKAGFLAGALCMKHSPLPDIPLEARAYFKLANFNHGKTA